MLQVWRVKTKLSASAVKKAEAGELACKIRAEEEIPVSMEFTALRGSVELPWALNKGSTQKCTGPSSSLSLEVSVSEEHQQVQQQEALGKEYTGNMDYQDVISEQIQYLKKWFRESQRKWLSLMGAAYRAEAFEMSTLRERLRKSLWFQGVSGRVSKAPGYTLGQFPHYIIKYPFGFTNKK